VGVAAVGVVAGAALLVPSLLAAAGNEADPAAVGAESAPVAWSEQATAPASPPGEEAEPPAKLVVHVAGAVANPGVYELKAGDRVVDALEAAGGATDKADLAALNLAAWVGDGERIYVPRPGETPPPVVGPAGGGQGGGGSAGAGGSGQEATGGGRVNVNQAGAEALTALPGIGPVLAQRIVDFRSANGPFGELSDLAEVTGIGPKILAGLADSVAF
jgi:competence protein ComEA